MPNFTDWTFVINGNSTVSITGINSQPASGDTMLVPTNFSGNPVISLGNSLNAISLSNSNVGIIFDEPSNVTTITDNAFHGCVNLSSNLVIPNSVTSIGEEAFRSTKISSLTLGSNLQLIGNSAFVFCSNLISPLVIPNSVTRVGVGAFSFTNISDLTLGSNLNIIEQGVFQACFNLSGNLIIPNNVTVIESQSFSQANIRSITLGSNVGNIDSLAFASCKNLSGNLVIPNSVTSIGFNAFVETNISALTLGSNVSTISEGAFKKCSNLSGPLSIPNSVTSIGIEAFRQTNISSLTIGSNIQSIVEFTFKDCANLSGPLVIPNNVQDIFSSAFENTNISSLTLGSNVNQIVFNAFKGTPLTGPLSLPNSLNFLGVQAFPPAVDLSLEFSGLSRQLTIIPNQDLAPNLTLSLTNPQPGLAFDSNTNVLTVSAAYGNLTADISQNPNLIITFTPLTIPCLVSPCKVMCVNSVEKDVSELCENDFVISSITKKPSKVIEVMKRVVNNFSKLDPENRPYRIPKDYFCHGLPSTDTMISGNHQLIFASNNKDSFYGIHTNRVMTTSYRVDDIEEVKKFTGSDQLTYYHVLLESGKDAFYANMMPVESYYSHEA